MNKNDIVHLLAANRGYRRCLVLRSQLTGPDCAVDPNQFDVFHQCVYKCPGSEHGSPFTPLYEELLESNEYDIALLDPWHAYDTSRRDLEEAFFVLSDGGALVCHDCWPHKEETTHPNAFACLEGKEWSGQTFAAWVDFVIANDVRYWTVDTDYGCGVAIKEPSRLLADPAYAALGSEWQRDRSYAFLAGKGRHLLNLISPDAFCELDFGQP